MNSIITPDNRGNEIILTRFHSGNAITVQDLHDNDKLDDNTVGINCSWQKIYTGLRNEIAVRHYSPKTLKSYTAWVRKFQSFTKSKNPEALTTLDVNEFLTFLAVKQKVSAASQNLAFNSLWFVFRNILKKDFGKIDGIVRAKKKPYIPVVLSKMEIDRIISRLAYPYSLIANLLYGCGLRLFECLNLRVNNFDFDHGILIIHDGKGKKDRSVPLPETLRTVLLDHLERVRKLHHFDLKDDIRTIQELLEHSDLRTTMIYTHTVKSTTLKEAKSPLDMQ